ncbi:MAG: hypothetical protein LC798_03165 [Chloroflexi bacterium]|nr:hypothetical protein [Chloroflexota bacterium]
MPRGPLPTKAPRRTNQPTIPTTKLPAGGFKGRMPKCPYTLGDRGKAWWRWAWHTPAAAAWSSNDLYALGRRAQLEDDLAALELPELDLAEFLDVDESDALKHLAEAIKRLKSLAGGRTSIQKVMAQHDKQFGLDAKAMADLRWRIEEEKLAPKPASGDHPEEPTAGEWEGLRVVDSA